ncbi:hypothetical protein [Flavobacterium lacisediminis]|uniref:Uncharacterized protein n=1 Tax=Flavobacterium lacisediminis TaxID=2989705 RepID=A0ABT3EKR5_9FLAO|nr:hypothetical protein [Flavobacterium lacisediminis]MCW1149172.1 hypothetical protein [Flavobacterium lacisediminis]
MTTRTHALEDYKKAIKEQYEIEKQGKYSSFLIAPSRAKLRQLCEERLKESNEKEDKVSFHFVFGFEYEAGNRYKLQAQTDKFRPIETFFKGETDLADFETINIAALLVDFKPRPFKVFISKYSGIETIKEETLLEEGLSVKPDYEIQPPISEEKKNWKNKAGIGLLVIAGLFSVGYTTKNLIIEEKECMQWQTDHYEYIDCNSSTSQGILEIPVEPADESKAKLRKIEVTETTTFFVNDKPVVWYAKVNGEPEFFNTHGFHPITGKPLKPITKYMIDKWVKHKE